MKRDALCILPRLSGLGGPASFRGRLAEGMEARGVTLCADPLDPQVGSILVIGGMRRLDLLLRARRRGVRIIQRLNGMNWIHRKISTGKKHFLRSEINNRVLAFIRRRLADGIVYQSQFSRNWWDTVYQPVHIPCRVVYNGVNLNTFTPQGPERPPEGRLRVLMVEGHIAGGYEAGLENGVRLVQELNRFMAYPVELLVAGDVPARTAALWQAQAGDVVQWAGIVARKDIPALDRSAHLLFSADLNAACPNSVIEALACGLPVVAFATGSLPELIEDEAGRVVPYGSNYWNLETPDIPALAAAAGQILSRQEPFRAGARKRAEEEFGLEKMVQGYWDSLFA